ncbi:MAG: hypothetical protein VB099_07705 [Candidatus Limiplasma sp.]|nr:hypothetical protein [Candidatus Limiplasma sp.]
MAQQSMVYRSYENEYGQEYVYPTERMYVHSSVYLPSSEIDPRTGLLKPDGPRRGRTQAKRLEYAHLDKEYRQLDASLRARAEQPGVRVSLRGAILLIAVTAFILGILLLSQQGTLAEKQKSLNRMNQSIEACAKVNDGLASQIAEASDAATICYTAARDLNMISGEAAEAIHLVAMDTRPLETQARLARESQASVQEVSPGEQTPIPAIASAGGGH